LHDLGKLGVSNAILEKPAKLTADEFAIVKKHPYYSYEILPMTISVVTLGAHPRLRRSERGGRRAP